MTKPACPVCQNEVATPVFTKNGYAIVQCAQCGLQYVHPVPTDEELTAHYQQGAYFHGEESQGYREYTAIRKALLPLFRRRLLHIDHLMSGKGRLLDFGCAAGYFLEVAQASGWDVAGVELSKEMATLAHERLGVPIGRSLTDMFGEFDVITLWEVIEHLPRPMETLAALQERLRPGGLLMLSTPNTGHWQAQREPDMWEGYRPPSHLLFFTADTLRSALERAGFQQITVQRTSPLPPMPDWLRRSGRPLQQRVADGSARPWRAMLLAWRAVRVFGWGWQRVARPHDDIYATLEAAAWRAP